LVLGAGEELETAQGYENKLQMCLIDSDSDEDFAGFAPAQSVGFAAERDSPQVFNFLSTSSMSI
jgi:hypothetical protein